MDIDGSLIKVLEEREGCSMPYGVVRGEVKGIGPLLKSDGDPTTSGVIKRVTLQERKINWKGGNVW